MKKQIPLNPPLQRGKYLIAPLSKRVVLSSPLSKRAVLNSPLSKRAALNSPLFKGGPGGICSKAFTLIEVMVVMAIISILAGMLMPPVWRYWESEEIATTQKRLENLKIGLVGDRTLVQNGVRTHYGYVGDHGYLPVHDQLSSVRRYLPAGFDTTSYLLDAWGNTFSYTFDPVVGIKARLSSPGTDGNAIPLDISEKEVTPTLTIDGSVTVQNSAAKSVKIKSTTNGWVESSCMATGIGDYAIPISQMTLPIGAHKIFWCYYSDPVCGGTEECQTTYTQKTVYIHDGMTALSYRLLIP